LGKTKNCFKLRHLDHERGRPHLDLRLATPVLVLHTAAAAAATWISGWLRHLKLRLAVPLGWPHHRFGGPCQRATAAKAEVAAAASFSAVERPRETGHERGSELGLLGYGGGGWILG
jgi:hypothetical protein